MFHVRGSLCRDSPTWMRCAAGILCSCLRKVLLMLPGQPYGCNDVYHRSSGSPGHLSVPGCSRKRYGPHRLHGRSRYRGTFSRSCLPGQGLHGIFLRLHQTIIAMSHFDSETFISKCFSVALSLTYNASRPPSMTV